MGNVTQKANECAPGAVINSMYWLQGETSINLNGDTPATSMTKLESDMSWTAKGTVPRNIVTGKLNFAQRPEHPLNLSIHYAASDTMLSAYRIGTLGASITSGTATATRDGGDAPPTFDYIRQQMALGQDVEIVLFWTMVQNGHTVITGGHAVVVSGLIVSTLGGSGFFFNDDAGQDGKGANQRTNEYVPYDTEHNIDLNLNFVTLGGLGQMRGSEVAAVISESPVYNLFMVTPQENSNTTTIFSVNLPTPTPGNNPGPPSTGAQSAAVLTAVPGSPFPAGTQAVAASSALQKYVYVANYGSNSISGYSINANTGALTALSGSPFRTGTNPFSIATDLKGLYAYVANFNGSSISAYSIDPSTGALTQIAGSPFSTTAQPTSVAVSPSGRLLFSSNSAGVSVYTIDPLTGALTVVTGSPFAAGDTPYDVAVDPNGQYIFVANTGLLTGASSVSVFSIGSTGALTTVPGSPFNSGLLPQAITIDPTGQFVYAANYTSNNVSAYTLNTSTGALTQITGSPYNVDPGPFGIAVDPEGQFVYVACQANTNGSIDAFSINAATGALTPVPGSPFAGGAGPARIALMPIVPNAGITNPAPTISQVAPSAAATGGSSAVVTVWGSNFVPGAVVRWNGSARNTEFISSAELNFGASVADLASAGSAAITVTNPAPGGGNSANAPFNVAASISIPVVAGDATVNDAGFTAGAGVSPGSIAASFGTGLANATAMFNGSLPAYVFASVGTQLNLQIPWELTGQRYGFATFTNTSGTSAPATVVISAVAPGIFTLNPAGLGAIINNTTGVVTAAAGAIPGLNSQPVNAGDYIAIFCTGLGPVSNQPADGALSSNDPNNLSETATTPTITVGGVSATEYFSGLAPGFIGLYQVVVQVPTGVTPGNSVPVVVSINGVSSNTATIAVQ